MFRIFFVYIALLIFGMSTAQNSNDLTSNYFSIVRSEFTGNQAYETTAFVEQYWRVVGNKGFNKSIYHIAKVLEKAGYVLESKASDNTILTYRIETRPLKTPNWEPIDASSTIVGEDQPILESSTNRNMTYLNAPSTTKGGVTAEVVYIKDKKSLKKPISRVKLLLLK